MLTYINGVSLFINVPVYEMKDDPVSQDISQTAIYFQQIITVGPAFLKADNWIKLSPLNCRVLEDQSHKSDIDH